MNLVRAEWRRLFSRRMASLIVLLGIALAIGVGVIAYVTSQEGTPALARQARVDRLAAIETCVVQQTNNPSNQVSEVDLRKECTRNIPSFDYDVSLRLTDLSPRDGQNGVLAQAALGIALGMILMGASFVGADWRAGTMATWLTWEPRRERVGMAKLAAAFGAGAVFTLIGLVAVTIAIMPTILLKGTNEGADGVWVGVLFNVVVRCLIVGGLAAVIGAGLALWLRSTSAAAAVALGYVVFIDLPFDVWIERGRSYLLSNNVTLFLNGNAQNADGFDRSMWAAGLFVVIITAVCGIVGISGFIHRDVQSQLN